jgi:hypothetical protein
MLVGNMFINQNYVKMNKVELISAMAEKAGCTKVQAKNALEAFIGSTTDALKKDKKFLWLDLVLLQWLNVLQEKVAIHKQKKKC